MSNGVEHFGKYMLLEKMASGGMAEVYLAKSTGAGGVNKFVAIKRILPQYSDNIEFIDMFKEEAKITVNLNHGNVVTIYDFGIERQQFFLVMEYVEGRNLRQVINEMKKTSTQFTLEQIVYMIKEVAAGLDHAHRCIDGTSGRPLNITHRDMSPQNIMVSFEGEVKIIDFGIAKAETQLEATKAGTLKGKFGYMSPEQADGQGIDLRTDVFSLGIVLWELLANDRLFTSSSEAAILRKIRECQIPSIRKINPSVPPALERIVNKALAKDKSLRYQTAAAFHRDLNRFLNTEYPEFSPHDFSVFMKNAFSQAFLDQRKRLVEFSKIQGPVVDTEKTVVTQTDVRSNPPPAAAAPLPQNPIAAPRQQQQPQYQHPPRENSSPALPPGPMNVDYEDLDLDTATDIKVDLNNLKNLPSARRDSVRTLSGVTHGTNAKIQGLKNPQAQRPPLRGLPASEGSLNWVMHTVVPLLFAVGGWLGFKNIDTFKSYAGGFAKMANEMTSIAPRPLPTNENSASKNVAGQTDLAATAQYVVTIESEPPGAKIFIDGVDTGSFTPYRRTVGGNKQFFLTIKKDGFLNYETVATVTGNAQSIRATLQPIPKSASVSINLINGGLNPVLTVNGQRLNETLPVEHYTIPAGVPIKIQAHNPFTGASAEQTITVKQNERRRVELILK